MQELYAGQRFHPQGHANTKSTRRERKRERSLNSSCEIFSPPAKRPIKERLGLRSGAEEPPTPVNSSTEKSRDLSTKFVAQNPSAKEVEEIPIVDVSSYSSSGVASNLSGSSRSPPSETPKLSPIVTQSHPSGPPPCRALLLDFEKPRPLMSINAPPPLDFLPPLLLHVPQGLLDVPLQGTTFLDQDSPSRNQGNLKAFHKTLFLRPHPQLNLPKSNDPEDLRSKIPRLDFTEPDTVQCDQGFEVIDLQNGLPSSAPSPTSDPIAVENTETGKENDNDSSEDNFTPNPDDFPGTLYDLLDDVNEDDWTKKPMVTKNNNKTLYPLVHQFIILYTQISKEYSTSFPSLAFKYYDINFYVRHHQLPNFFLSCVS